MKINKKSFIKDHQIINAADAKALIAKFGISSVFHAGAYIDEDEQDGTVNDIHESDYFEVLINHGDSVQLYYVGDYRWTIALDRLKGQCIEIIADGRLPALQRLAFCE